MHIIEKMDYYMMYLLDNEFFKLMGSCLLKRWKGGVESFATGVLMQFAV